MPTPPRPPAADLEVLDPSSVRRRVAVRPGMCGPTTLFASQLGDWTWETVSALCGTDVLRARDAAGAPAYLAFSYLRIRGAPALQAGRLRFGDRLEVVSRVFGLGSESVLTLHRLRPDGAGAAAGLEPAEFYEHPDPGSLYVESYNRWVSRGREESNLGLVRASPPEFRTAHLPVLPERHSPRVPCWHARAYHAFPDTADPAYLAAHDELRVPYAIDPARDVNGAGLIHFAAYFAIVDGALARLFRRRGGDARAFLKRRVVDQRVCFLANAEVDARLTVTLRPRRRAGGGERVEAVVCERGGGVIAVAAVELAGEAA